MERFAGPALLFAISVLFHWKLVLTNQYTWLESGDIGSLILPWFQFQAGEWHQWRFPLWDPYSWAGQPLLGQAQPGAAYPLNWLLFWMPLDHGWLRQDVLHWFYVLVHYLAGLTAYALARDLGRSRLASVLAGVVYSLGGYVASIDSPQMLHGAIWSPLVLLFLFRAERGERPLANSLLSGFFLGVAWLVGHHQMQIFLSLAVTGVWILLILRQGAKFARFALAAFLMTAATSAFQTLPAAEYGRQAVRWVGADEPQGLNETVPYPVHEQYALKPMGLAGIFVAGVEQGLYHPFAGVAALTLGILGALACWRERYVRWLATLALCGVIFALGGNSVFHGMFYALAPLVEKARVPEAATSIFALGLAPLVAFGLDSLKIAESAALARRATQLLAGFGAALAFGVLFLYAAKGAAAVGDGRMLITALCAFLAAGLFSAWRARAIPDRFGAAAAIALVLFELGNVTDYHLATADRATHPYLYQLAAHYDLAAFIKGQGEPARVVYDSKAIPYNIGDWYGLEALNAYAASVPASLWQHSVFSRRVEDVLGVRYYLGTAPERPDLREVFQGASGVKIFENPRAFPRVWSVHGSVEAHDRKQARAMLADPAFDARNVVFMMGEKAPPMQVCSGDEVWMPRHRPNSLTIRAAMNCRGMVILTDSWYPGWEAAVDGRPARIEQAYGAFRGVMLDAGDHTIEMRYRPWSVFLGAAISAAAACVAMLCALL